jgi:hypothetical protein
MFQELASNCPAACDNPTAPEIYDCIVQGLKLPADIEVRISIHSFNMMGLYYSATLVCASPALHALLLIAEKKTSKRLEVSRTGSGAN